MAYLFNKFITNRTLIGFCRNATTQAASPISILRKKTSMSYSLCREALNKNDNDITSAESWLQAYSLTHGQQKAAKLQTRTAKEGLISLAVSSNHKLVTFIELNCETDFVAKNQSFRDFALSMTKHYHSVYDIPIITNALDRINQVNFGEDEIKDISSDIVALITKLGENIKLGRALRIFTQDSNLRIFSQIHPSTKNSQQDGVKMEIGRFGAIACLRDLDSDRACVEVPPKELVEVGNRICNHVIGFSPEFIELPDEIKVNMEKMENEKKNNEEEIEEASHQNELQDDDDIEESSFVNPRDEWPSIMDQTLILSNTTNVRDYCKKNNVDIEYFRRFECGFEI